LRPEDIGASSYNCANWQVLWRASLNQGAVESGKFADLIAVEGPFADITVLQHHKWVMKDGRIIKNDLSGNLL
jgi:imidazolonepropionase-like amidohydrolase